jgi:hypothetical protein
LGRSHGASRLEDHRRRHSCCPGLAPRCPIVVVLEPTPDDFNDSDWCRHQVSWFYVPPFSIMLTFI